MTKAQTNSIAVASTCILAATVYISMARKAKGSETVHADSKEPVDEEVMLKSSFDANRKNDKIFRLTDSRTICVGTILDSSSFDSEGSVSPVARDALVEDGMSVEPERQDALIPHTATIQAICLIVCVVMALTLHSMSTTMVQPKLSSTQLVIYHIPGQSDSQAVPVDAHDITPVQSNIQWHQGLKGCYGPYFSM